jgi:putative ABC transport system ATP-binding protein
VLSTVERVLFLKSADIFREVASEELVAVALAAEERDFFAGDVLIRQGDLADCLYLVVRGEIQVVVRGSAQVAVLGPHSVVGELGLLSGRPRTADCIASSATLTLRVGRDDFWALLEERPQLALGVINMLTRRLEDTTARLAQLQAEQKAVPRG